MLQGREIRAVALGAAAVMTFMGLVLMSGRVDPVQFSRMLFIYLGGSFALWFIVGLAAMVITVLRGARASGQEPFLGKCLAGFVIEPWRRDRGASLFWPPLLFAVLMASFNAYKQMVLPIAGFGLDPLLREADKLLFLGVDPWRATHAVFGSPTATMFIDRSYHGWFLPMALGLLICAWLPASTYKLRTQYILSYIGVWIGLGSVLAFILPSAGPCYYSHFHGADPSFDELLRRLREVQEASGTRMNALANQSALLASFGSDQLGIGRGISAMPSVHNGLAVLFALAGFQLHRAAGILLSAYAVLIWIGSIHLGWHYALDGIVAAGVTIIMWRISGRIADRLEAPLDEAGARPAIA
jgi:hypothetical protein